MSKTILIVDNAATTRRLVAFAMQYAGYSVYEAENGADAMEMLDRTNVDLIIANLTKPEVKVLELIRQLRRKIVCKYTPVIVVITETQDKRYHKDIRSLASGWLIKPFLPGQLAEVVKRFLK